MRQLISSGSVKCIYLDRNETLRKLANVSREAMREFPHIEQIRLFGSLARGDHSALSDIDLLVVLNRSEQKDELERVKPYYRYFADRLGMALDMLVLTTEEARERVPFLSESILICSQIAQRDICATTVLTKFQEPNLKQIQNVEIQVAET